MYYVKALKPKLPCVSREHLNIKTWDRANEIADSFGEVCGIFEHATDNLLLVVHNEQEDGF